MIGVAIGNTLSTIVINVLSSCVYEGKQKAVDTVKLNKLKIEMIKPVRVIILIGLVLKDVIPSKANDSILPSVYLDSPANRFPRE